ncbi:polysaccharide deacetylase [Paenibacillus rhizophilus]|uniref:Polysaccharide deacetylase n=1 Tax=Paenibacillus rhizophilus TaxID=1850366 RepID=A0A3N9NVB9_9BACL|nr:polysaccharide deacetylase [Paenibacillus rhizophilus]RQW07771.1 polysaccharide deacetylase [Paenibacillus rhizophilus]
MVRKKRGISRRKAVRLVLAAAVIAAALIYREAGNSPFGKSSVTLHAADRGGAAEGREGSLPGSLPGPAVSGAPNGQANAGLSSHGGAQATPAVRLSPASHSQKVSFSQTSGISNSAAKAAAAAVKKSALPKTVYLTFDDGPSSVTPKVLEILRREQVKATFFVLGNGAERHPEWINAIWEQGSSIGNHTYDHNYKDLYSSFTRFWGQIKKTEEIIRLITGVRPQLVRAPGGTFDHFDDTYFHLMKQAGYRVTDWTLDSGDSKRRGVPASEILKNSISNTKASKVVLLLHDGAGHEESAKALPEIIERYKAAGYVFKTLDDREEPVQFKTHPGKSAWGRVKPAEAWIDANITPNAALFASGKKLVVEAGMLQTTLQPGEYRIENGRYIVPLRAVVERLGGRVSWAAGTHSGQAELNGRKITADTIGGGLALAGEGQGQGAVSSGVTLRGGAIWLPLRDLLEVTGHHLLGVTSVPEERRVKAS